MNLFKKRSSVAGQGDATLVMLSLGGNRQAYGEIVSRYQTLLCSLAYSSTGDFRHSEDIAQEAFVEGWRKLDTLHDPEKLKSWLCGILRFKVSRHYRKTAKETQHQDMLLTAEQDIADEAALEQTAISEQQQTLLWQVLDQLEPLYREPMILFYREEQSVQRVAEELELSEDAVKQRISRGRKLLKEAMSVFVEDALKHSKPGAAFTVAVMTMISGISPPAKAAVLSGSALKTGSLFKFATLAALLASVSGLIGSWFSLKASLAQSRTKRERHLVKKSVTLFFVFAALYIAGMVGLKALCYVSPHHAVTLSLLSQTVVAALVISYVVLVKKMFSAMKDLRALERITQPEAFIASAHQAGAKQREYISAFRLLGVPFCHFQFGMPEHTDTPAYGWIAAGSHARGLLFAWGGVAVAPVSVGIISFGLITIGGVGVGVIGTGTVAFGVLAFGASAIGYQAFASLSAVGWQSAISGGFSMAREAALGAVAIATHANNEIAADIARLSEFQWLSTWVFMAIALLVIVPAIWHARAVTQRMKAD